MSGRIIEIIENLSSVIEGIEIEADCDPSRPFRRLLGANNIRSEHAPNADRAFTVNLLRGSKLADFGLQNRTENLFTLEITVCYLQRADRASQEKILSSDIEKIMLALEKPENAGKATLVTVRGFAIDRASAHYIYATFEVSVRYGLSTEI